MNKEDFEKFLERIEEFKKADIQEMSMIVSPVSYKIIKEYLEEMEIKI